MSNAFTQIFSKIPPEELNLALQCGLLLGSAASIFYLFFGRLLSIPELLGIVLKNPKCKTTTIQPPALATHSSSSQDSFFCQPYSEPSITNISQLTSPLMTRYT